MSCKNGCNYVEFESEVWLILANIVVTYSCSPAIEPAKRGARHQYFNKILRYYGLKFSNFALFATTMTTTIIHISANVGHM